MTFTYSDNHATDYPALGMCDICGVRFTHGCEHSNTMEAQEWLAAHAAVEQSTEQVDYFIRIMEETRLHPVDEAWAAEKMAEHAEGLDTERTMREAAQ